MRVRNIVAVRALMVIGMAPLFLHHPGHTATTLVDLLLAGTTYHGL